MNDYIKREDAVKIIERLAKQLEPPINIRLADVRSGVLSAKWLVEDMQSADVRENVRGYWKKRKDKPLYNWYQCSNCGAICGETPKYCSECGADMRGGKE